MANQDEFMASETAKHIVSTSPTVSNTLIRLPPRFDGRKNRSEVWNHFTMEPSSEKKAKCNYCGHLVLMGVKIGLKFGTILPRRRLLMVRKVMNQFSAGNNNREGQCLQETM
ncbi:Zinc finger, BED-type [Sesbania bispinosa]|nr:Zinc finger, BED-type [Sesbania bispinosa]